MPNARHQPNPDHSIADKLGQNLIRDSLISQDVYVQAKTLNTQSGRPLGFILLDLGVLAEEQLLSAYSELTDIPVWDKQGLAATENPLDPDFMKNNKILPVEKQGQKIFVVCTAEDQGLLEMLKSLYQDWTLALGAESDIEHRLQAMGADGGETTLAEAANANMQHATSQDLKDLALEAPIIRQVNHMINNAIKSGASDIHLEPVKTKIELRYRVDGVMHSRPSPSLEEYPAVVSRIKILANLDIAERRLPQDGRFTMKSAGRDIDIRVSTIPTNYGEDVNLRLLSQNKELTTLDAVGLSPHVIDQLKECLKKSYGLILITGPTGSGKTTTLYSGLKEIIDGQKKIITVEDPIEYEMDGITQIQVNSAINLNFSTALRSILRHDPDVVLIGEIRDRETAEIAVQASLTGHLVLSTIHTNSALGSVSRLLNMGVPDYLLASSLLAVSSQRLVRRLCDSCKQPGPIPPLIAERFGIDPAQQVYTAVGCGECGDIGYQGRTPIAELATMTSKMREMALKDPTEEMLTQAARDSLPEYKSLLENGLDLVFEGKTTIDEVMRVAS